MNEITARRLCGTRTIARRSDIAVNYCIVDVHVEGDQLWIALNTLTQRPGGGLWVHGEDVHEI